MTETPKTETAAVPGTAVIPTDGRNVLLVGADLVSPKFIAVLQALINFVADGRDLGLNMVVLRDDNLPVNADGHILGEVSFNTGAISINLEEVLSRSYESAMEFDNVSIYPVWWNNQLLGVIHELVHMLQMRDSASPKDWLVSLLANTDGFADKTERDCREVAIELYEAFVQNFECEPPPWHEEVYFARYVVDLLSGEDGKNAQQVEWLDGRVMVYVEIDEKPCPITDFRGYAAMNSENPEDEAWNKADRIVLLSDDVVTPSAEVTNTYQQLVDDNTKPAAEAEAVLMPDNEGVHAEEVQPGDAGSMFAGAMFAGAGGAEMPAIPTVAAGAMPVDTAGPGIPSTVPQFVPAATPAPAPQQAAFTPVADAAAGGATQQMQPVVEVYPNHNLSVEDIRRVFYGVCNKIQTHVATVCQMGGVPEGATAMNDIVAYGNPKAADTHPIPLTEEEMRLVVKCEVLNDMGQRETILTSNGQLRGWATKNELPMYMLHLNVNGQDVRRAVVPQNPNKRNAQQNLSNPASLARTGVKILWVMEGNDAIKKANPSVSMKAKCSDGQWEIINS